LTEFSYDAKEENVKYYDCEITEYKQIVLNDNYVMHMFISLHWVVGNVGW